MGVQTLDGECMSVKRMPPAASRGYQWVRCARLGSCAGAPATVAASATSMAETANARLGLRPDRAGLDRSELALTGLDIGGIILRIAGEPPGQVTCSPSNSDTAQ